jgi:pyruvate/2-oxoglutarate dehydrogenase complex dihydrolipoamide dehydrogenase (E3) component
VAKKQKHDYDLIIIGSGAAGGVAAHIAMSAGKHVAMVESDTLGGECPNWGCIPSKALLHVANIYDTAKRAQKFGIRSGTLGYNYPSIKAWKDAAVRRTHAADSKSYYESKGVDILKGEAHFISPHEISINRRHLSAKEFLIATGSTWRIPEIEGLEKTGYLTARDALELIRPPKSLFIVGSGAIGCEFAELFSVFGTKVYMADVANRILPREDTETSELIENIFTKRRGMTLLTSAKVMKVAKEGVVKRVTYERGGRQHSVKVDEVLIAAGQVPNTDLGLENAGVAYTPRGITVNEHMQTSAKHIYAAGGVTGGYVYTHVATYESRVAMNNMLKKDKIGADYLAIPRVTFITPEVASVGMSEEDCLKRDMPIKKAVAPITMISRSNTSDTSEGFVKVMADKNGILVGGTVVSPRAGEVIHELTVAIQYGLHAREVAAVVHAYPTWSEAVRAACSKIN